MEWVIGTSPFIAGLLGSLTTNLASPSPPPVASAAGVEVEKPKLEAAAWALGKTTFRNGFSPNVAARGDIKSSISSCSCGAATAVASGAGASNLPKEEPNDAGGNEPKEAGGNVDGGGGGG